MVARARKFTSPSVTGEFHGEHRTARAHAPEELRGILHVLTCGSVDDGKSTLIGRLLWDAADLPADTRQTLLASAGPDGQPDLSLLVDGLAAEREQGITIDIAWRYFDLTSAGTSSSTVRGTSSTRATWQRVRRMPTSGSC